MQTGGASIPRLRDQEVAIVKPSSIVAWWLAAAAIVVLAFVIAETSTLVAEANAPAVTGRGT